MDALTNTNAPVMYDLKRFGREVMGLSGMKLKKDSEEFKFVVDQAKKFNEMRMKALASGPGAEPQFMSLTNPEGRVVDVLIKPDGEPMVVEPKTLNTQQGMFTMANPTNAAPIVDPRTGQQVMGYAAEPAAGDVAQTIGPYSAQPTQSPTPAPAIPSSASPAPNNMPMQFRSAEEVKAAYRSNAISREQAVGILANQFGIK